MISFIVSAHDRPIALRLCLLSLILQKYTDWEMIVVDNAETDEIARQHEDACSMDARIKYLRTGCTTCYESSEIGAGIAKGDWLCFPSDDSYYLPEFAGKLISHAEANKLELVYCDLVMAGEENCIVLNCQPKCCHIDKTNFMLKRNRMIPFPGKVPGERSCSDGLLIDELMGLGIRQGKVPQPLCVHNL
jgi:glycosyltransferase involved in cell wall biosynthesis